MRSIAGTALRYCPSLSSSAAPRAEPRISLPTVHAHSPHNLTYCTIHYGHRSPLPRSVTQAASIGTQAAPVKSSLGDGEMLRKLHGQIYASNVTKLDRHSLPSHRNGALHVQDSCEAAIPCWTVICSSEATRASLEQPPSFICTDILNYLVHKYSDVTVWPRLQSTRMRCVETLRKA